MPTPTQRPTIEITREHPVDDGCIEYHGRFPEHPDWTFWAFVKPTPDEEHELIYSHRVTRLQMTDLHHKGKYYYGEPFDPDDEGTPIDAFHEVLLYAIDEHFGPSLEERQRISNATDTSVQEVHDELASFLESRFQTADPDHIRSALNLLLDNHRKCRSAA